MVGRRRPRPPLLRGGSISTRATRPSLNSDPCSRPGKLGALPSARICRGRPSVGSSETAPPMA
eukprot:2724801-Pyramimonas_sp.AAC.1